MAIPAKAGALTTLGPAGPPPFLTTAAGSDQTYWNIAAPPGVQLTAPANGVLTRFRTASNGTVTLRVIAKSGANYVGAGTGPQVPPLGNGIQVTTETHMPIAAGETIGIDLPAGTLGAASASGWTFDFADTLADGGPPQAGSPVADYLAYVSADFELDNDQDKFGDDTQDKCLGTPGQFNGCPNTVTLGKIKQKGNSKVKVAVTVPGQGTLKAGSPSDPALAAAAAKRKSLLKPVTQTFSSTSKQQATLILKLTKSAKSQLIDNGKLKLKIKLSFTPTGGPAGSQTAKKKLKS
jgi:hypothetical protein